MLNDALKGPLIDDLWKAKEISESWTMFAGERLGKHTRPMSLKKGRLLVAAEGPAWSSEFHMSIPEIKERIERITGIRVEEIIVSVKDKL